MIFFSFLILAFSTAHGHTYGLNKSWIVTEEFLSPDIPHFDCHSSSLVEAENGTLYAVWKGGTGEGKSNIDVNNSRLKGGSFQLTNIADSGRFTGGPT